MLERPSKFLEQSRSFVEGASSIIYLPLLGKMECTWLDNTTCTLSLRYTGSDYIYRTVQIRVMSDYLLVDNTARVPLNNTDPVWSDFYKMFKYMYDKVNNQGSMTVRVPDNYEAHWFALVISKDPQVPLKLDGLCNMVNR